MAVAKETLIYYVEGKIVCEDCIGDAERDALAPEDIITVNPGADSIIFICSRCQKRI